MRNFSWTWTCHPSLTSHYNSPSNFTAGTYHPQFFVLRTITQLSKHRLPQQQIETQTVQQQQTCASVLQCSCTAAADLYRSAAVQQPRTPTTQLTVQLILEVVRGGASRCFGSGEAAIEAAAMAVTSQVP